MLVFNKLYQEEYPKSIFEKTIWNLGPYIKAKWFLEFQQKKLIQKHAFPRVFLKNHMSPGKHEVTGP